MKYPFDSLTEIGKYFFSIYPADHVRKAATYYCKKNPNRKFEVESMGIGMGCKCTRRSHLWTLEKVKGYGRRKTKSR